MVWPMLAQWDVALNFPEVKTKRQAWPIPRFATSKQAKAKGFSGEVQTFQEIRARKKILPCYDKDKYKMRNKAIYPTNSLDTEHWICSNHPHNLLSTLHYHDLPIPLSSLMTSLLKGTFVQALIVHYRNFPKDLATLPWKESTDNWGPKSLWIFIVSPMLSVERGYRMGADICY